VPWVDGTGAASAEAQRAGAAGTPRLHPSASCGAGGTSACLSLAHLGRAFLVIWPMPPQALGSRGGRVRTDVALRMKRQIRPMERLPVAPAWRFDRGSTRGSPREGRRTTPPKGTAAPGGGARRSGHRTARRPQVAVPPVARRAARTRPRGGVFVATAILSARRIGSSSSFAATGFGGVGSVKG